MSVTVPDDGMLSLTPGKMLSVLTVYGVRLTVLRMILSVIKTSKSAGACRP